MKLQPNIGSDRSWVWKVTADYAESPPTPETLAIRFANSESKFLSVFFPGAKPFKITLDAGQFKAAFEEAQKKNAELSGKSNEGETKEEKEEEEEEKEESKESEEKKEEEEKEDAEGEKKEGTD